MVERDGENQDAGMFSESNPLLRVEHVTKTYRTGTTKLEVLTDVNFELETGQVVALMGPSGVGKTTLLNIIGALDTPDGGTITLRGKRLSDLRSDNLAAVRNSLLGFVFQFHHLLPEFTALENVMMPGLIRNQKNGANEGYAIRLLTKFGLGDRVEHYPHELSGGEKQRVALARALMNDPALVLADEPTGNLDRKTGAQLIETILDFSQEHQQTFIIATHDEAIAGRADKVLFLRNGVIKEERETENLEFGTMH